MVRMWVFSDKKDLEVLKSELEIIDKVNLFYIYCSLKLFVNFRCIIPVIF